MRQADLCTAAVGANALFCRESRGYSRLKCQRVCRSAAGCRGGVGTSEAIYVANRLTARGDRAG